jgi:hypothetical protein
MEKQHGKIGKIVGSKTGLVAATKSLKQKDNSYLQKSI